MRRTRAGRTVAGAGVLVLVLGVAVCRPGAAPPMAPTLAIEGVTAIPMDGSGPIVGATVVVRDGVIAAVGPSAAVRVPAGATRIDGRGGYVIPGLTDMHAHPLSEDELVAYLRHGVTTVMVMRGRSLFLDWRSRIESGSLTGPTLYSAGPTTDGLPPLGWKFTGIGTPEAARCVVRHQVAQGYDAIKVYNLFEPPVFAALNAAADEAGVPVVGHIPREVGAGAALAAGQDMIAHGEEYYFADFRGEDDQPELALVPGLVDATAASGAWVTPMLSSTPEIIRSVTDLDGLLAEPAMREAAPATYHNYVARNNGYAARPEPEAFVARNRIMYGFLRDFTVALHRAGVPLLVGTDAGVVGLPGVQVHRELSELVDAGLTPLEAVEAATASAGRFAATHFGDGDRFGVLAAGARADLVLLREDPRRDIGAARSIAGVVARGRWFSPAELDQLWERATADYAEQRAVVDRFDAAIGSGEVERAVELARRAQRRYGPDPLLHESVVRRHAVRLFSSDPEGALALLRLNAELYPDFHAVHRTLGQALALAGDSTAAVQAYERARELSPCDGVTGAALRELGDSAP